MPIPYNGKNKSQSQYLRKSATRQERHLWYDFLKNYPVQFRRQVMFDNYIADFYCHQGRTWWRIARHAQGQDRDQIRMERLESYGLTVIRISNGCIDHDFRRACMYIDQVVKENVKNHY